MSQTLVQRDFTTQSIGTEAGQDIGSFMRRPYGPSLSGWTVGWSAANDSGTNRKAVTKQVSIGSQNSFLISTWFYFSRSEGNTSVLYLYYVWAAGSYIPIILKLHPDTMVLDLFGDGTHMTSQNGIATLQRRKWVNIILAGWRSGINNAATIRVLIKYRGQAIAQAGTDSSCQITTDFFTHVNFGTYGGDGGTPYVSTRIGLPSTYTISGTSDMIYPSEIVEPNAEGSNVWYCSSAASGGGNGTTLAQAFTPAEVITYAAGPVTFMPGDIIDSTGAVVDVSAFDAKTLYSRYRGGTALHNGDIIYFNDASGPIRFASQCLFPGADNVRLLPDPNLGRKVDIRGTTRLSTWTNISGANYKKSVTCAYPVLFEFDSVAEANSITGRGRCLTHPAGITTSAGFAAASTDGSFGTDGGGGSGTEVYVRATGSGNPDSNGKVYEVTTGNNIFYLSCWGGLIKDLVIRYGAAVGTNNTGGEGYVGDSIKLSGNNLFIVDRCDMACGGRHLLALAQDDLASLTQRFVIVRNTFRDCIPTAYCGVGGQTITVNDAVTDPSDNQWYYADNVCLTNVMVVGSINGALDTLQPTMFEHTSGGAHPFSKGWAYNNIMLGDSALLGSTTTTFTNHNNNFSTRVESLETKMRFVLSADGLVPKG